MALGAQACKRSKVPLHPEGPTPSSQEQAVISRDVAISISKRDALQSYGTIDGYDLVVVEQEDSWRIKFELKDKSLNGGGPAYVIDKRTGKIISKQYSQ